MIKKYGLITVLTVVAILMVMVKLSNKNKDWSEETMALTPSPTPTNIPSPTPTMIINEDYPLWQQLPYEGEGFVIDRYVDKKTVVVQRKGLDKKIVEQGVYEWFDKNNVATEGMKIKWE